MMVVRWFVLWGLIDLKWEIRWSYRISEKGVVFIEKVHMSSLHLYKNSPLLKRLFLESTVVSNMPLHLVKGRVQNQVHRLGRAGTLPVIRITVVVVTQESPITSWSLHVPESTVNEFDQVCDRGCQVCLRTIFWKSGDEQAKACFCVECVKCETPFTWCTYPNLVTWTRARTGSIFRRDTRGLTHIEATTRLRTLHFFYSTIFLIT